MGVMYNRNAHIGSVILGLIALAAVAAFQPGYGGTQDISEIRKAAERGDAEAQALLAEFYSLGYGVPQDYREAAKWLRKAAEQGHAGAQAGLGASYVSGKGVPQDWREAAKWLRKAAKQGHAKAQMRLGGAYAKGKWVPQDLVKAYAWLNLAAAQGSKLAVAVRDKLRPKMTGKQVAEAQKLATELWDRIESPKSK